MNEVFGKIEGQSVILLTVLIAAVLVDILLHMYYGRKSRYQIPKKTGKEQNDLLQLREADDESFILLRKKDKIPVYVSDNVNRLWGITPEFAYADSEAVIKGFSDADRAQLIKSAEQWDGRGQLLFQGSWQAGAIEKECRFTVAEADTSDYFLITLRDITEQRTQVQELQEEIQRTRQSEESKTVFLSNMSHEIRTPLNGMLGMIGLTKMNLNQPQIAASYLEKSEDLSKFLLSVINDILDMSRIESGKTELEAAVFDIRSLGNELKNMFQTTLEDKGIHFQLDMQDIQDPYVVGDQLRTSQVLTNFLSNSSKFTPEGGMVTLTIRQMDVVEDKISWMFRVTDTGKGMPPEFLHKIFKPFEQEDSGITRKYGGSGLGMAIADNLVKLMGGQILVESELGRGTTFTVFVRLPKADETELKEITAIDEDEKIDLSGRRLLMAEDQAINALIVVKMLGAQGITVEVAKDGIEAVEMFEQHEDGYYDAILMDIHMPNMNGWDATGVIRRSKRVQAITIPIFALSADAFVEDKRKSIEAGMNGHITKPIDYAELQRELQRVLRKHEVK